MKLKGSKKLEEIELKIGVLQITKALSFLHSESQIVHLNISPSCIYLDKKGIWKLCGFNFSVPVVETSSSASSEYNFAEYNSVDAKYLAMPSLDYLACEYIFVRKSGFASDLFSFGCLLFEIYSGHKLIDSVNNVLNYKQSIENMHPIKTEGIPSDLGLSFQSISKTVNNVKKIEQLNH